MYSVLFTVFGYEVKSHGVMAPLGAAPGVWLAVVIARRRSRYEEAILDFLFWAVIAGVIGSRLWEWPSPGTTTGRVRGRPCSSGRAAFCCGSPPVRRSAARGTAGRQGR